MLRRVRIKLDRGNDSVFSPGDTVSGNVEYKSPGEDTLETVTLDFRGVSKVMPDKGSKTQVLDARKAHLWPFEFVFPERTGPDRTGKYQENNLGLFEEKPHDTPPSIGPGQSRQVRINYHLYAIAGRAYKNALAGGGLFIEPLVDNIDSLNCLPLTLDIIARPMTTLERIIRFNPQQLQQKKRLNELLRRPSIQSHSQALQAFSVVINAPSTIVPGSPILLSFLVKQVEPESEFTGSYVPHYSHKATTVTLVTRTYRRTTSRPYSESHVEIISKVLGIDKARKDLPLNILKILDAFPTSVIKDWPPSFKSYSISRSYSLDIDIVVKVAGYQEDLKAHFEVENITVIRPASDQTRLARRAIIAPPPTIESIPRDDVELPPYQP